MMNSDLGVVIRERYKILKVLGQGGTATTFAAKDLSTGRAVALKVLSLKRMKDWKTLELFEREAKTLANLDHPAIPKYLHYFEAEQSHDRAFYLVQELAPGASLFDWINRGWRPTLDEVQAIVAQVLETLVYLHQLTPPVIHRDIKPQNLIRQSNGRIFLVDFGAVQETYHNTVTGGSTVIGTFGYMAPEQFRGQAVLSTDLYGLGTTLLFLLTGRSPADLPQRQLKIDFRTQVQLPKRFGDWLDRMIEPVSTTRFFSAEEALAVLQGKRELPPRTSIYPRPQNTAIRLTKMPEKLSIEIPPTLANRHESLWFGLLPFFITVLSWSIISAISAEIIELQVDQSHLLLRAMFVVANGALTTTLIVGGASRTILFSSAFRTRLTISPRWFIERNWFFGIAQMLDQEISSNSVPLAKIERYQLPLIQRSLPCCVLKLNSKTIWFGLFLSRQEQEWLVDEIQVFIKNYAAQLRE